MNLVNKYLFIYLMCVLGLEMMLGVKYLEVFGIVWIDVFYLGVGLCEYYIYMLRFI